MKKSTALFAAFVAQSLVLSAQNAPRFQPYMCEPLPDTAPEWMQRLAENPTSVNYFEMDSLFESWAARHVDVRVKTRYHKPAVNFFRRWQRAYRPFVDAKGNILLPEYEAHYQRIDSLNALSLKQSRARKAKAALQKASSQTADSLSAVWHNIGPNQTVAPGAKPKDSQACVYRLAVAPSAPNILYCGTESGVIFRSDDKGLNWKPCNAAHFFGGPTYALQVDPSNPDIVYAGGGLALWKSTDGGDTWKRLEGIRSRVNSIRIHPENNNRLTVATAYDPVLETDGGFYVSEDGGQTFEQTLQGIGYDHELKPGDPETVYLILRPTVGYNTFFYKSTDGGRTFRQRMMKEGWDLNAGRLAVSEAPGGEDYVYALVTAYDPWINENGVGKPFILQSKDGGEQWKDQTIREYDSSWDGRNTFFGLDEDKGGQGYFDMTLGVSNKNPEHVIFGLCSAYRSTKGGYGGWGRGAGNTAIGGYTAQEKMHPDIQDIAVSGDDTWIATDGGIKYSADFFETVGTDRMKGIYAADYHGFDMGWNEDVMAGGRWHNGDAVHMASYGKGVTMHVGGVEYPTGHVMLSDPRKVYFSDAGHYYMPTTVDGVPEATYNKYFTDKKPFEVLRTSGRIVADPRYALRIIMNGRDADDDWGVGDVFQMYESLDEGETLTSILNTDGERINNYEFARSNPDVIYVSGQVDIHRSQDGGKTWNILPKRAFGEDVITGFAPMMLAVHPRQENTVWVTNTNAGGAVAYTTDGGETWTNPLDENMKETPFCWIILTGDEVNGVYLGSANGAKVFYKDDTMENWMDYSAGLNPGARLTRLMPFYKEGTLRAATDQGIWEIPLVRQDFKPVAQPIALNLAHGNLTTTPQKEVWLDSYSIVKQEPGTRWEWSFSPEPQRISDRTVRNPKVVFGRDGEYDVTLRITTPSGKTDERTIKGMIQVKTGTGMDEQTLSEMKPKAVLSAQTVTKGQNLLLTTQGMSGHKVLTVHNAKGHLMQKFLLNEGQNGAEIHTSNLSPGVYLYEVKSQGAKVFGKFIVNN